MWLKARLNFFFFFYFVFFSFSWGNQRIIILFNNFFFACLTSKFIIFLKEIDLGVE